MFDANAKIKKNLEKQAPGRQGSFLGLPRCGPGGAKSVRTAEELQFLKKSIIKTKASKTENHEGTADPGCQTETVPEEAKSHRTFEEFDF